MTVAEKSMAPGSRSSLAWRGFAVVVLLLLLGAHLIVVNNTPTYINVRADVVILRDVASILPEIAKRVLYG